MTPDEPDHPGAQHAPGHLPKLPGKSKGHALGHGHEHHPEHVHHIKLLLETSLAVAVLSLVGESPAAANPGVPAPVNDPPKVEQIYRRSTSKADEASQEEELLDLLLTYHGNESLSFDRDVLHEWAGLLNPETYPHYRHTLFSLEHSVAYENGVSPDALSEATRAAMHSVILATVSPEHATYLTDNGVMGTDIGDALTQIMQSDPAATDPPNVLSPMTSLATTTTGEANLQQFVDDCTVAINAETVNVISANGGGGSVEVGSITADTVNISSGETGGDGDSDATASGWWAVLLGPTALRAALVKAHLDAVNKGIVEFDKNVAKRLWKSAQESIRPESEDAARAAARHAARTQTITALGTAQDHLPTRVDVTTDRRQASELLHLAYQNRVAPAWIDGLLYEAEQGIAEGLAHHRVASGGPSIAQAQPIEQLIASHVSREGKHLLNRIV